MSWGWIWGVLTFLLLANALRLRRKAAAIPVLPPSEAPVAPGHRFLVTPGVHLDETTQRAASAYAKSQGLEVLDLIPADAPVGTVLTLLRVMDPAMYRRNRVAPGRTAGQAMLITDDARAEFMETSIGNPVSFVRAAVKLKRYACTTTDLAVASGLRAVPGDPDRGMAVLREVAGGAVPLFVVTPPIIAVILAVGVVGWPAFGLAALVAYHLQPLLILGGLAFRPRDLAWSTLLRTVWDVWGALRTALGRWRPSDEPDAREEHRPVYQELLAGGIGRFFEPRQERCPLCSGSELSAHLQIPDLFQHKPGQFALERCRACGHIFQNPRLSLEGLNFYYRDFYDGLGEAASGSLFAMQREHYLARARMLQGIATPTRWLDVGGGHGDFCCLARDVWPDARFDALDLSESIDEAVRSGWVDRGYRGLFPDLAKEMDGTYDVVSMSHYLEHTRDPRAELIAARRALRPGGYLLIEVPDPDSPFGRLLGRYWLPWFQPQHQHFVSVQNLMQLFREESFTPVLWHRGEAHIEVNFMFATLLLLMRLAVPPDLPWRPRTSWAGRTWHGLVWTLGLPPLLLAHGLDALAAPFIRRWNFSNAYRVLARRD
jgi:ubiquinone/menaquinone biosynthesis C-methylase UbiE